MLVVILINLTPVQNFLVRKASAILSEKLKTKVTIKHVRIDLLNHALLQGVYVEDHAGDTLLYAGEVSARITDWFFLKKGIPVIHYIGLDDAYIHLYRTTKSDEWNYQFIADAFSTAPSRKPKKQTEFEIGLKKIQLDKVRFHMDDAWGGVDYDIDVGSLLLDADDVDMRKKTVKINVVELEEALVNIRDYETAEGYVRKPRIKAIDTTPFNKAGWTFSAKKLSLANCRFVMNTAERPAYENEFDPAHMDVSSINLLAESLRIDMDTLTGAIKNFSAKERSGFVVTKLSADVSVSPNASVCKKLFLQTPRSKIYRYYAMHYQRFPDFEDYVDKVVMAADFKNAVIDYRDVAYFAPVLRKIPAVLSVNGTVAGSVDSLVGKNLYITDGNSRLLGDLSLIGLPNMENTFIQFQHGELYTNKKAGYKYFPELKDFRTMDLDKLSYVHYKGSFTGYVDNFAANGVLNTALGSVVSNVHLTLPGMDADKAVYTGTVSSSSLDVGALFRQPDFGKIALSVKVDGRAFDPKNAAVNLDGDISSLEFNGYRYTDINAVGTLAQKKFEGKLLINDPNLALAFYGNADFSQPQLQINATANLLSSNLKALNFTKDSITAVADFDLNYIGNTLDEFTGYARLYNINIRRDNNRLDVDSVYLQSANTEEGKALTLESNLAAASIRGKYLLSRLPYSFQYYISGYLPNYIVAPTQYAPDQDIAFHIETRQMDSLLAVIAPQLSGFSNSVVNGVLNTNTQQLTFDAIVPYGKISGVSMNKALVKANGNFRQLKLDAETDKLSIGEDIVTASVKATTTLGNDSLSFAIATNSDGDYGTANINGYAYAHGDSLYLSLAPSDFYLNANKWDIPAGNQFVFSKEYVFVRNLYLRSGEEEIAVNSYNESVDQAIDIKVANFDLAMLGNLADIAAYQPNGKVNGTITLKDLYRGLQMQSRLVADEVMFGTDTIGTVTVFGGYDAQKEIITLEPQSGIRRGNSSLQATGSISLDTANNQALSGNVQFDNADINWIRPLVSDLLSHMSGKMNGMVTIGGSALRPDVNGSVKLTDAATRIDVTGAYYRIPEATITVDNETIDFGNITLIDNYENTATLTGGLRHERFRNIRFNRVQVTSPKFEVLNLTEKENNGFYGNLIANVTALTVSGTVDDIRMNIRATPADESHIFIPVQSGTDLGSYSYITFKQYGDQEEEVKKKKKNKFSLTLTGDMNPLAQLTLVLDPATGDLINGRGYGNITLSLPADEDMKMYGNYEIEEGDYTFTFRKLFFVRTFKINQGSRISFNGLLANTNLNIDGIYTARVRLSDLLTNQEKEQVKGSPPEWAETNSRQDVNILLNMKGSLEEPLLNFKLDIDKRFDGTVVAGKLMRINQDYSTLFDQVASLLLVGTLIPTGGILASNTNTALSNNVGEVLSSTFSSQLTNMVSKLLNDPSLAIELRYNSYSYTDGSDNGLNRNEVSLGIKKNFLKDRLIVELGSAYDWGRPASTSSATGNLNLAGDFRAQYLLTEDGRVRLNAFNTTNYDVLNNGNLTRRGVGISYRRSFDNLGEFFNKGYKPPTKQQLKDSIQNSPGKDTSAL